MPQNKKPQEFFGIHRALAFHPSIRKFAVKNPGLVEGTKELSIVFEAATKKFFFANLSFKRERIVSFGKIYARAPDAILDLMKLIRTIVGKWQKSDAGIVKIFLLTHQTVFVDNRKLVYDGNGNTIAIVARSKLDDTEERTSVAGLTREKINELSYPKLTAVGSLLDKEIATLLNVKPESVKKARQMIAQQDKEIAFWENPDVVR